MNDWFENVFQQDLSSRPLKADVVSQPVTGWKLGRLSLAGRVGFSDCAYAKSESV